MINFAKFFGKKAKNHFSMRVEGGEFFLEFKSGDLSRTGDYNFEKFKEMVANSANPEELQKKIIEDSNFL